MYRAPVILVILASLLAPKTAAAFQQQPQQPAITVLQLSTPIERTIASGQSHVYALRLDAGQFAQLVVDQHGIDVIISVAGPDSKKVGDFDSPNGDDGPENVSFIAESSGDYLIGVRPLNQGDGIKPGKYEIRLLELRKATDEELKSITNREALREKALALVQEATLIIPQVRSLPTRVHAQMQASALLRSSDDKAASKLMSDAVAGLKEFMNSIDYNDQEALQNLQPIGVLRYELIQALAASDPEGALSLLRATRPPVPQEVLQSMGMTEGEEQLELTLANQVAQRDPKRAYQIAQETLKTRLSGNLFHTVLQLQIQDPELARKLAKDIMTRLLEAKFLKDREAFNLALDFLRNRSSQRRSAPPEANGADQKDIPLLSDQDRRDLLQKTLNEALTNTPGNSTRGNAWNERDLVMNMLHMLKSLGTELDEQFPGSQAAVEKRLTELQKQMDPQVANWQKYQQALNNTPPEAAAEVISQSPPEMRTQLYQQLADRAAATGDINRARQIINEKVTNPWQRRQALQNLEQQTIYQYIAKGRIEEGIRALAAFRPLRARANIIAQIARQVGPGRKRSVAIGLLDQLRGLLGESPQADNQDEMNALFEISAAFAKYDSKKSFEILDPLVDQFNEINDAARKLSGFSYESHKDGEVDMYNGNLVMNLVNQLSRALASLSTSDFEKAKADADRLQAPEVRLVTYLNIAQQIIQPMPR